jgi:PAS domain S-box-containing protein
MNAVWFEVDEEGRLLRRSDDAVALMEAVDPPVSDLVRLFELRADIRAAVLRRAGHVRFGLGRGPGRVLVDADVSPGGRGARMVCRRADGLAGEGELGRLLLRHAELHPDAFLVTDPDGVVLWCDASFCDLVRWPLNDVIGRHRRVFRSPAVPEEEVERHWRTLFAMGVHRGTSLVRRSDGVDVAIRESVSAVRDPQGRVTHYVSAIQDISRESELERLRHLDHSVQILSRVAGSEAHAVNGLAAEMLATCESALLSEDPASAGQALDRVIGLAGQLGDLGRRLLAMSATPGEGATDLSLCARDLATLIERLLPDGTPQRGPVTVSCGQRGPLVRAAAGDLLRVGVQLALRALDGGIARGGVTVEALEEFGEGVLRIRYEPTASEREALRWLLPDTTLSGPVAVAAFRAPEGSAISVERREEPGGGVAIDVRAPTVEVGATAPPKVPASDVRRWRRVVVAEDNEALRGLMCASLEGLFAEVVPATDGAAALRAVLERPTDLLVLDLRLPDRSGMDVLAEALAARGDLRVIVASGAASDGVAHRAMSGGARAVLPKPFRLAELRAVVRSVLDDAVW